MVKNHRMKQREPRSVGDCWQWRANGWCCKRDNCSFRDDINKRAKTTQPNPSPSSSTQQSEMRREPEVLEAETQVEEWLDCRARITSKELAPIQSVKNGIHQSARSTSQKMEADLGEKCSHAHRQVDEQPSKRSKKNGDKSAVAVLKNYSTIRSRIPRKGAAVFIKFAEEFKHTEANSMCSIHRSRVTSC